MPKENDINYLEIESEIVEESLRRGIKDFDVSLFKENKSQTESFFDNYNDAVRIAESDNLDWQGFKSALNFTTNFSQIQYYFDLAGNTSGKLKEIKVFFKRVIRKLIRFIILPLTEKQSDFNAKVGFCLNHLSGVDVDISNRLLNAERKIDNDIYGRLNTLEDSCKHFVALPEFEKAIDDNADVKKRLEKAIDDNADVEKRLEKVIDDNADAKKRLENLENTLEEIRKALIDRANISRPKYNFGEIVSSSQSGEDTIIAYVLDALKIPFERCTYLDLGANHPQRMNNSFFFYSYGARGVLVEANPAFVHELEEVRPGDTVLNRCVAEKTGELVKFYILNGDGLSTTSYSRAMECINENKSLYIKQVIDVRTISISDILSEYFLQAPMLLSIDIEGMELTILKNIDFNCCRPLFIVCETIEYSQKIGIPEKRSDIIEFLTSKGYAEYAFTGINSVFIDVQRLNGGENDK